MTGYTVIPCIHDDIGVSVEPDAIVLRFVTAGMRGEGRVDAFVDVRCSRVATERLRAKLAARLDEESVPEPAECPFCERPGCYFNADKVGGAQVYCGNCGASGPYRRTKADAAEVWDRIATTTGELED